MVYQDLFTPGSGNRFSRRTGQVILYGRLQLELGALEDPLAVDALEDSLNLGALERPSSLSVGLNTVDVLISDNFGNFSDFSYSFDVSLTIPSVANFGFFSSGQDLQFKQEK